MAINSCNKGKAGERAWANWLQDNLDVQAKRGFGQGAGGQARPDVESSLAVHWEVKCVERLNVNDALSQAIRDARFDNIPVVAHKRNRSPWLVTLLASDLEQLSKVVYERSKRKSEEE